MKKLTFVFLLFCLSVSGTVQAGQPLKTYARFSAGVDAGGNAMSVKPEYGLRWWFIDASLSYTVIRSLPIRWPMDSDAFSSNNAFMLNLNLDVLKLFWRDSHHGVTVGGAVGLSRNFALEHEYNDQETYVRYSLGTEWLFTLKAAYQYEKAVLSAFKDARNAIVEFNKIQDIYDAQLELEQAARKSIDLTRTQYLNGYISYLDMLDAQRTYLDAQIALSNAVRDKQIALVQLYKALGGGWE